MGHERENFSGKGIPSIEELRRERDPKLADFWDVMEPRIMKLTGSPWTVVNPIIHSLYEEQGIKDASAVTDEMILEAHTALLKKQEGA